MVPRSIKPSSSKAMNTVDINRCLCNFFFDSFMSEEFKSASPSAGPNFADYLRWLVTISIAAAIEIRSIAEQKFGSRSDGAVFVSLFDVVGSGTLRELGTQQACQVIPLALGLNRLTDVDQHVEDMFRNGFLKRNCSLSFINAAAYTQLIVFSPQRRGPFDDGAEKEDLKDFLPSSTFEVLVFIHGVGLLKIHKEDVKIKVSCKISMRVSFAIQKVFKTWKAFLDSSRLGLWGSFMELYLIFDYKYGQFNVTQTRSEKVFFKNLSRSL